jgi:hypothetical protein
MDDESKQSKYQLRDFIVELIHEDDDDVCVSEQT